jgi:hypothetical protein
MKQFFSDVHLCGTVAVREAAYENGDGTSARPTSSPRCAPTSSTRKA